MERITYINIPAAGNRNPLETSINWIPSSNNVDNFNHTLVDECIVSAILV